MTSTLVRQMLHNEAQSLMARLQRVKPFRLHMPMVAAAALPVAAQNAIDRHMNDVWSSVAAMVGDFQRWLHGAAGRRATDDVAQRHLTVLRLRYQSALTQFDLFADVLTQRSEHEFGVWLAGLDTLATDALNVNSDHLEAPALVCYLDRGIGAAIRRARTRLPGGRQNPVAIIRVPRERMIGAGIASSLVHEVGHQGAALLNLVASLRSALEPQATSGDAAWRLWQRWISEIIADVWSVAHIGVGATLGLMGVVSLPRAFVFRISEQDPHPAPWIRVMLSAQIGQALYPDPQWQRLQDVWQRLYPLRGLDTHKAALLQHLRATLPALADHLLHHTSNTLRGRTVTELFPIATRQPDHLRTLHLRWSGHPAAWRNAAPALAFAVIGQARADGRLSATREATLIDDLLTHWAANRRDHTQHRGCRCAQESAATA